MKTVRQTLGVAVVLAFCLNNVFASTPEATTPGEASAQDSAAVSGPVSGPGAPAPGDKLPTPKFGAGMQIPVDGTSLAAFEQSLEGIKTKTTKAEYTTLTNAIDYLLVYYIDARRDPTKLAALLNGKTGVEIVSLVQW